jgi:hypothetical protein
MWVTSFGNGLKTGNLNSSGINESGKDQDRLTVYPNPVNEKVCFTFSGNHAAITEINIFNLQGQNLVSGKVQADCIPTSDLVSGIYVIEFIFNDHSRVYKKFVKQEEGK